VSRSPKSNESSSPSCIPASLTRLPPICAPRFPSWDEVVHPQTFECLGTQAEEKPARPQGLFEGLLQGHVEILASDAADSPDKYDPQVLPLILELSQGMRKKDDLTSKERVLLDRATLDFASYVPPKKVPPTVPPPPARRRAASLEEESGTPIIGVDVPAETEVPAFWWLK
jgi:hypothetical protein